MTGFSRSLEDTIKLTRTGRTDARLAALRAHLEGQGEHFYLLTLDQGAAPGGAEGRLVTGAGDVFEFELDPRRGVVRWHLVEDAEDDADVRELLAALAEPALATELERRISSR